MKALQVLFRSLTKNALCIALLLALALGSFVLPQSAQAEDTGTVNAKVILRKSASKDSNALQTLPEGEEIVLLGNSGDWYKVNYGIYTGYIMKKFVKTSKAYASGNTSKINELGAAPGFMRIGDNNSDVKKLQQALKILGYYDGKIDSDYGQGTTKAVLAYQQDKKLDADGVAGKDTVKAIFGSCAKNSMTTQPDPGAASSSTGTSNSKNDKTSSGSKSSSKYKTVSSISAIGSAPSATKEGDSGTNVVKLQQALECLGYYSNTIDGDYGAGTVSAVKRLQKNRGMKQDGIAGSGTLHVLFGSSTAANKGSSSGSSNSKGYKTEVLDWFEDSISSVIPKNAKFTVKDIKTGKTFQAVRWSGVNHCDTEPRTSADTATLKSIYGGEWSWNRRAILVQYNGHVYAASMNGMPHGTTTISNGYDGHFCIHFKNSKTHGTKKVDPDHQSAVNSAGKASW